MYLFRLFLVVFQASVETLSNDLVRGVREDALSDKSRGDQDKITLKQIIIIVPIRFLSIGSLVNVDVRDHYSGGEVYNVGPEYLDDDSGPFICFHLVELEGESEPDYRQEEIDVVYEKHGHGGEEVSKYFVAVHLLDSGIGGLLRLLVVEGVNRKDS